MTVEPLTYGGQPILQTDLRVANGYIHVIGGVVVPPSSSSRQQLRVNTAVPAVT